MAVLGHFVASTARNELWKLIVESLHGKVSSGLQGQSTTVRRNALGARGIDRIETVTTQGTSLSYPVYDGHGNMVATLAKQGSGYQIGNRRSFGAWGEMRQGQTSSDPKNRYCANMGHVDDEESNLIYMRARYYDPSCGRFSSEDLAHAGKNWYVFCNGNPVNYYDPSGKDPLSNTEIAFAIGFAIGAWLGNWVGSLMVQNAVMEVMSSPQLGLALE